MRLALLLLTCIALAVPAYADPGRGGEGRGDNNNGARNANEITREDKERIKSIETEDDYWAAVDDVAGTGITGLEAEQQGLEIDWDHLTKSWDKNWDRLGRESEKLNR